MLDFRPLKAEDVEVRVGTCSDKGVSLLLYKDARCDMRLLDETVGPENWECRYEEINGSLFCTVSLRFGDGNWVSKQDVGTPSNMEATKGEASDAFKRACFKWGIGRELYTAPFIWVPADKCSIKEGRNGKKQCYDDFRCTEMEVDGGQIVKLTICNMSRKGAVVYGIVAGKPHTGEQESFDKEEEAPEVKAARLRLMNALSKWAELHGRDPKEVAQGVKKDPKYAKTVEFYEYRAADFEADIEGTLNG